MKGSQQGLTTLSGTPTFDHSNVLIMNKPKPPDLEDVVEEILRLRDIESEATFTRDLKLQETLAHMTQRIAYLERSWFQRLLMAMTGTNATGIQSRRTFTAPRERA